MALFRYQALTEHGRLMEGTLEAASPTEARAVLEKMNLSVQQIQLCTEPKAPPRIGQNEFLLFNQQLASLTKADIPLEQGLRQLARDAASTRMKQLMEQIADDLQAGLTLEQAVAKREKQFPPLYSLILKTGIQSGRLSEMLIIFNHYLEITQQTRRILIESLTYPAVVLLLALLIITLVCRFIMPTQEEVIRDFTEGGSIPLITTFYIRMSYHIVEIWVVLLAFAVSGLLVWRFLSSKPAGRLIKESFLFRIPLLGRTLLSSHLARLAESMGLLVAAGCPLPQCFRLGGEASGSETLQRDSHLAAEHIESGGSLLEAAAACRKMPMLFLYSLQLGCQRNDLAGHLKILAQTYVQQTQVLQSYLRAMLDPLAILGLGFIIASMILALFLPYTSIFGIFL
ncbi:MAG TPA: type II secretion system F family protein [Anaerohalosphaeraceae bacterium]|nr:type II secretion system F family protein [Anaerohalosphaeraceae bacterium]